MLEYIRKSLNELHPGSLTKPARILMQGGIVIAAADSVYGLVGRAFNNGVFARLNYLKSNREKPYVVVYDSVERLNSNAREINLFQWKLIRELLPGSVTLIIDPVGNETTDYGYNDYGMGVRVMPDSPLQRLARAVGIPLWATSANIEGQYPPESFEEITEPVIDIADIVIDSGVTEGGGASTVVDIRKFPHKFLREGFERDKIDNDLDNIQRKPLNILMVCTGNICRSPFAEVYLQSRLGEPENCGFRVSSAGTHAQAGRLATDDMLEISEELRVPLQHHSARQLTDQLLMTSDLILTAEQEHLRFILELTPQVEDRVYVMSEIIGQSEIPDPFGDTFLAYNLTASLIRNAIDAWSDRLQTMSTEFCWAKRA